MQTFLNSTQLNALRKERSWPDSWWHCSSGIVSVAPCKLSEVPRTGEVSVLNDAEFKIGSTNWVHFRYPAAASDVSEKQKVALEFMGHSSDGLSREEASALLNAGFYADGFDSAGYKEFKWQQRHRLYSRRQILMEGLGRLQGKEFLVSERLSDAVVKQAIDEAMAEGINEDTLFEFLKARFPKAILAESTRRKKLSEARSREAYMQEYSAFMKSSVDVDTEPQSNRRSGKSALWTVVLVVVAVLVWWLAANWRIVVSF